MAMPAATTMGPTLICSRGPMRADSAPERADRSSMMTVSGSSEAPAAMGLYPATICSSTGSRNSPPASAP